MGGRSFHDVTTTMRGLENNMAAVFVSLRLSVLGAQCEILWFVLIGRMLLRLHSAV